MDKTRMSWDGRNHPQDKENFHSEDLIKPPTKRETVLAWLIENSELGIKVTRFDAEPIGDHCLNTSVSEIERLDGVRISRRLTKRPTRFGKPTDCKEYWIAEKDLDRAYEVLAIKQEKRVA